MQADTDVLIIGAGPAGLTAGYLLTKAGRDVKVVLRNASRLREGCVDILRRRLRDEVLLVAHAVVKREIRPNAVLVLRVGIQFIQLCINNRIAKGLHVAGVVGGITGGACVGQGKGIGVGKSVGPVGLIQLVVVILSVQIIDAELEVVLADGVAQIIGKFISVLTGRDTRQIVRSADGRAGDA